MAKIISKDLKFGPYKVLGKAIATGGMAQVYKVENSDGEIFVAKTLLPQYLNDKRKKSRFLAEFDYLQKISSENVVKAKEIVDEKGVCCLILEFIDGIELNKVIRKIAPLDLETSIYIILELCKALDECHEKGIFHRDIKPENILISREGKVRLIDLGVVKHVDTKRTLPGTVLGTLDYMSPEQIEGERKDVKNTVDLYALGIILYELVSKKLPIKFTSKDGIIDVYKKKKEKLPKAGKLENSELEQICLDLIQAEPEDRIQSIYDLEIRLIKLSNKTKIKKGYKLFYENFSEVFFQDKIKVKAKAAPKKEKAIVTIQEEILVAKEEEHKTFFVIIGFAFLSMLVLIGGHFMKWWDLVSLFLNIKTLILAKLQS
ncbi:serine/threonine protein kinase [bacterium]|nr:serine/threonine protein kinase [bacterium]